MFWTLVLALLAAFLILSFAPMIIGLVVVIIGGIFKAITSVFED